MLILVLIIGSTVRSTTRVELARNEIRTLSDCVELFRVKNGRYPTNAEGLAAATVSGDCGTSAKNMRDPWGHPFVYRAGLRPDQEPEIFSYGADGKKGGGDDVSSRTQPKGCW